MGWDLDEAKQDFDELLRRAREEGPQEIVLDGEPVAIVVSAETYRGLRRGRLDFKAFLMSFPGSDHLRIERADEPAPKIDL